MDDAMSTSSQSAAGAGAGGGGGDMSMTSHAGGSASLSSTYQVIVADGSGALHTLQLPCSSLPGPTKEEEALALSLEPVKVDRTQVGVPLAQGSGRAVQRMAQGWLHDDVWVLAVGRRDGTIDVIALDERREGSSRGGGAASQRGRLVGVVREPRMRAGMERWVGLAVGKGAVYSCTSAGAFRVSFFQAGGAQHNGSESAAENENRAFSLPSPLQDCAFHPAQAPTHFAYGGEEIPLSIWSIAAALAPPSADVGAGADADTLAEADSNTGEHAQEAQMNAKARKRKRQAQARSKARELLHGEVFRAKNLPNDGLSLPQRPNITSLAFAFASSSADGAADELRGEADGGALPAGLWVLAGTRDGLLRTFEPGSGVRKQRAEARIVPTGQGEGLAIKALTVRGDVSYVADTSKRLYAVDWRAGKVLGQIKGLTGTVNSILPLPAPSGSARSSGSAFERLVTASQDRLVRLHHVPAQAPASAPAQGPLRLKDARLFAHAFGSAAAAPPVAVLLDDRALPLKAVGGGAQGAGDGSEGEGEEDGDDDEEDDELGRMDTVGGEAEGADASASARRKKGTHGEQGEDGSEEEDDDVDAEQAERRREAKAKRARGQH